ncbi:MAG: hypothetical protein ACE5DU_04155 [Nitrosopumilus sp.]
MYDKLEIKSTSENKRDNLFDKFNMPVEGNNNLNIKELSINQIINESVENAINNIVTNIIKTKPILTSSKDVNEIAKICKKFFNDSNFGIFEYTQRTGRNSFKVRHSSGINGTKFLGEFFRRIFNSGLKDYSFHNISNNTQVCIIFR